MLEATGKVGAKEVVTRSQETAKLSAIFSRNGGARKCARPAVSFFLMLVKISGAPKSKLHAGSGILIGDEASLRGTNPCLGSGGGREVCLGF